MSTKCTRLNTAPYFTCEEGKKNIKEKSTIAAAAKRRQEAWQQIAYCVNV